MKVSEVPVETRTWLLESDIPRVRYNAALLFNSPKADAAALHLDPIISQGLKDLQGWNEEILTRHDKADLLIHRLAFLADMGVNSSTPGIREIADAILSRRTSQGLPLSTVMIPKAFRGSGEPEEAWIICDAPQIVYGLLRMGAIHGKETEHPLEYLASRVQENGFRCISSLESFRGPGSVQDPCPYANLLTAKAFSFSQNSSIRQAGEKALESILRHVEKKGKKYFLFGAGTDFYKLKFPFIWYNILHVLEAISLYPSYHDDPRTTALIKSVLEKADPSMRFTPESIYMFFQRHRFRSKEAAVTDTDPCGPEDAVEIRMICF